jgi:hypothetical protein
MTTWRDRGPVQVSSMWAKSVRSQAAAKQRGHAVRAALVTGVSRAAGRSSATGAQGSRS